MFPYDPAEVQQDAQRLVEKMVGQKCRSTCAILPYVVGDDGGRGCKIIFQVGARNVADAGSMLGAAVANMAQVVSKLREDIRGQLGDEAAEEFMKSLMSDVDAVTGGDGDLKQMTAIMTGDKTRE
jgi:transcription antitermination factor NusA-like protein